MRFACNAMLVMVVVVVVVVVVLPCACCSSCLGTSSIEYVGLRHCRLCLAKVAVRMWEVVAIGLVHA